MKPEYDILHFEQKERVTLCGYVDTQIEPVAYTLDKETFLTDPKKCPTCASKLENYEGN